MRERKKLKHRYDMHSVNTLYVCILTSVITIIELFRSHQYFSAFVKLLQNFPKNKVVFRINLI